MNHSRKYIASGIVVSNLVVLFAGAFLFNWFWNVTELHEDIALVLISTIILVTAGSAIASYFWSFTGIPLKSLRLLAVVNHSWIIFIFFIHPEFGMKNTPVLDFLMYNFFSKACLVIIVFCSLLGNWFGRRVFYE